MAVNTCLLYSELAIGLGAGLEPFCDLLLTNLLKMANLTKKITAQQSQATVTSILTHTFSQPKIIIPLLWIILQEKAIQARAFVVGHIETYLEVHERRAKSAIETSGTLEVLDKCMRKAITDTNPAVREAARKVFWKFNGIWPANGAIILESLDSANRRQLEKVCPDLENINIPSITPKTVKKGSVAAAIAASRAKAKAIATAPPTLYHQATSASHNLPSRRRSGSPSSSTSRTDNTRPISPLRLSSSPPSVRPPGRTGGCVTIPTLSSHRRSSSAGSGRGPLSLPDVATGRRSSGSNNTSSQETLRRAVQTALPVSPPTSPLDTSPTPRATDILARHAPPRPSSLFPQMSNEDESLLLAQSVPIPLDDESDYDLSTNLTPLCNLSRAFCPPVRKPLTPPESQSPRSNGSKPTVPSTPSISDALTSGSIVDTSIADQPAVEDAMKARAEQAESAAERLLELVDPDIESTPHPSLPSSLLLDRQFVKPSRLPATPLSNTAQILKQAAMFQDSPANSGRTSLMDILQNAKQESWWPKRKAGELTRTLSTRIVWSHGMKVL